MKELRTYPESDKFYAENERIGFYAEHDTEDKYNIWICELFKNKKTEKFSVLLTADDDEELDVIEFE